MSTAALLDAEASATEKEVGEMIAKQGFESAAETIRTKNPETKWWEHVVPAGELEKQLGTNLDTGLTSSAAASILERDGPNALSPPKETPEWIKFLKQMTGMFSLLLWFGSFLSFFGYILDSSDKSNLYIGIVLAVVVFLTGCFSYLQEKKSSDIMKQFGGMLPEDCSVIRDGREERIKAEDLVVGDLVKVEAGEKAPADLRVIQSSGLKVDHSALTGETEHLNRAGHGTHFNPQESGNVAFFGAALYGGSGIAVVVKTGDLTEMGRIKTLASSSDEEESPINVEIHHFIKIISSVAVFLGVTFFVVGIFNGTEWISNLVFMIGIIVANVPEGLLATVTVSLSLTAQRMHKQNVLVRKLEAVETLGSTSCICSDKTGTLTQNIMTVVDICIDNEVKSCGSTGPQLGPDGMPMEGVKTQPDRPPDYQLSDPSFIQMHRAVCLATLSSFADSPENMAKPIQNRGLMRGNASDHALVKFGERSLKDMGQIAPGTQGILKFREANKEVAVIPFNSSNKWELHVAKLAGVDGYSHIVTIKGATERVKKWCDTILIDGKAVPFDHEQEDKMTNNLMACMDKGYRILAFAQLLLPAKGRGVTRDDAGEINGKYSKCFSEFNDDEFFDLDAGPGAADPSNARFDLTGFTYIGFAGLQDPPREGVKEAVRDCHTAGIKVVMVTGDHPGTARAIAQQVGILKKGDTPEERVMAAYGLSLVEVEERKDLVVAEQDRAPARVIPGWEIPSLTENDWDKVIGKEQLVFARTSPEQKLIIVDHCQQKGMITAVTGDGVNDSPALKKAHIGVAMGITGTPVAKDVADMILLDDSFASIVTGVKEGRLIFDNLKKSIAYTLSSNIPEITPFLSFIAFGIPPPLSTVLILCVDLGTDMLPAISLAYERAESDIMRRSPRTKDDQLVTSRLISFSYFQVGCLQALAGFFSYLVVLGDYGFPPWILMGIRLDWSQANNLLIQGQGHIARDEALRNAQTAFFVTIVVVQWADLLICKTRLRSLFLHGFHNNILIAGLIEETILCVILCYIPQVNLVFGTRPLRVVHWLPAMPFSLTIFAYDETRKFLLRRSPKGFLFEKTYY